VVKVTFDLDEELYLRLVKLVLRKYKKKRGALGLVLREAVKLYLSEMEKGEEERGGAVAGSTSPTAPSYATTAVGAKKSVLEAYVREVYYNVVSRLGAKPGSRVPVKVLEEALVGVGKDPSWIDLFEKYGLVKRENGECVLIF
jgi:hypothetical protein